MAVQSRSTATIIATRRRASGALIAAVGAVVLGIGGAAPAAAQDKEPILIGGTLCLTGIQAPLDAPGLKGAEIAVKAINEKGGVLGRPLKFINLDGKSDPVTVGNNATQLVAEGVHAIISPCDFDFGSPAHREAQKAGIVAVSTCASSPLHGSITLGDKQFTLSMWNTTMGSAGAEFALSKGWKKAYVVTDTFIDYTTSLSEYFIKHFQATGGTIITEDKYTQGAQDFSAQLARLQRSADKPDVLFISSYMPDLATIIRAIREAGIATPIVGGDSYDDSSLFGALGEKFGNDVYFVTHSWMAPGVTPAMADFLGLYEKEYGAAPDTSFVATGWDTVQVLAQAMAKADTTDGAAVAKAMEELQFDLLTGKLDWSDARTGHEPDIEAALVAVQGGKASFIGWTRPSNVEKPPYVEKYIKEHPQQ
ncbi:MAG: ABC transporter substrate-binding protein [Rhodospirillales bacterium]|nr:ABC transporter substrate-binding protein [Rhodospirillales bacterium]